MSTVRAGVLGALVVVAIVVVVIVLTSGGGGTHYQLLFQSGSQLVTGDDVQIGGRRIGNVDDIVLTKNNLAEIKVTVSDDFAPLHKGTTAIIRATSQSGVANHYVSLSPGPNNAPELPGGTTLGLKDTTTLVDLDQVFDTIDAKTRQGLKRFIRGSADQYRGKGPAANATIKYFNPALSTATDLTRELSRDQAAFTALIVQGARVVTAIDSRATDLTNLVSNTNQTAGAISAENSSFSQTLQQLPPTLRRANTTFVNLRSTLADLTPVVNASKTATKNLVPFLVNLRPLVHDSVPTIADVRKLISQPGADDDLIDLLNKAPKLAKEGVPTFKHSDQALRKAQPVVEFARPYVPDLEGWFRDFGEGAASYDANGHYARIGPVINGYKYDKASNSLKPLTVDQRLSQLNKHQDRRCPGTASQATTDGSAPFTEGGRLDCDPKQEISGP